jgi:hypothetical protein
MKNKININEMDIDFKRACACHTIRFEHLIKYEDHPSVQELLAVWLGQDGDINALFETVKKIVVEPFVNAEYDRLQKLKMAKFEKEVYTMATVERACAVILVALLTFTIITFVL